MAKGEDMTNDDKKAISLTRRYFELCAILDAWKIRRVMTRSDSTRHNCLIYIRDVMQRMNNIYSKLSSMDISPVIMRNLDEVILHTKAWGVPEVRAVTRLVMKQWSN